MNASNAPHPSYPNKHADNQQINQHKPEGQPRKHGVIYARISDDKTGQAIGVQRQIRTCQKLAEIDDFEITEIYTDNSISAYKNSAQRSEYLRMCEAIKRGEIDRVYVYSTDRLARNTRDTLDYFDLCKPRNVITRAVTGEGIDPHSANAKLVTTILGAIAEQESAHKAERIKAAYEDRALKGRPKTGGRRMFGYNDDATTLREDEAEFLREAATRIIDGETLRSVALLAGEKGFTSTRGNVLDAGAIRAMLTNPRIAGLSTWNPTDSNNQRLTRNRTTVGQGQWEPVLDMDTFERVNAVLKDPARATNTVGNTPQHLLSGLISCPCGQPLYYRSRSYKLKSGKKRKTAYYGCKKHTATQNQGKKIEHTSILAEPLDQAVQALIIERLSKPDFTQAVQSYLTQDIDTDAAQLATLHEKRRELEDRIASFEQQAISGEVAPEVFGRVVTTLHDQLAEIVGEIEELTSTQTDSASSLLLSVPEQTSQIAQWWAELPLEQQRRLISSIVEIKILQGKQGAKKFDPRRIKAQFKPVVGG